VKTAREQLERLEKARTHQELDKAQLFLLTRFRSRCAGERNHELERNEAGRSGTDGLRKGRKGEGSAKSGKEGMGRRTVFVEALRACFVSWMCENLYLQVNEHELRGWEGLNVIDADERDE
jgi:hypothetical protein